MACNINNVMQIQIMACNIDIERGHWEHDMEKQWVRKNNLTKEAPWLLIKLN